MIKVQLGLRTTAKTLFLFYLYNIAKLCFTSSEFLLGSSSNPVLTVCFSVIKEASVAVKAIYS